MRNELKSGAILAYSAVIVGNVISLLYTPFLMSKLGTSQYGLFALSQSIMSYMLLLNAGMGSTIIRYNSKYRAENNYEKQINVNGMFLAIYSVLSLICLIFGVIFYNKLEVLFINGLTLEEIRLLKAMFIVVVIYMCISLPGSIFSGIVTSYERFIFLKGINLLRTILSPICIVGLLLLDYKAFGALIAVTSVNLLIVILNVWYCFTKLKIKIKLLKVEKSVFFEIVKFSFFVFISAVAYQLFWNSNQIILGALVSSYAITIFAIAIQLNLYFTSFSNSVANLYLPKLTRFTVNNVGKDEMLQELIKVSRIQFIISSYLFTGILLIGKQFIIIWLGEDFSLSYILALLIIGPQVISVTQSIFASLLESMNKHQMKAFIYLFVAIINIAITFTLAPQYEGLGCAIAIAIGMSLNAILNNIYYRISLGIDLLKYWKQICSLLLPVAISLVLGYAILQLLYIDTFIKLGVYVCVYSLLYISILHLLGLNEYEKKLIIKPIKKFNPLNFIIRG